MTELFQDSSNGLPLFEETEIQSKFVSHNDILQSRDMIYYEVYTSNKSTRTMVYSSSRPINYIRIKSKLQRTRYMLLPILTKHPYNQGKSNEFSRWWIEWYTSTIIKELLEIVYNQRILIISNACPDSKKYIQ